MNKKKLTYDPENKSEKKETKGTVVTRDMCSNPREFDVVMGVLNDMAAERGLSKKTKEEAAD